MRPQTCIECQEAITNPICPDCIEKEVLAWLSEKSPDLVYHVRGKGNSTHVGWITTCIVCNNKMSLCAHCYTKEVLQILKDNTSNKALINDFIIFFDFEIS